MSLFGSTKSKSGKGSSEFSVFIREASSREKKRVYDRVLKDSIAAQDRVVRSDVRAKPAKP
jgi:hypothetical protein